MLKQTWIVTLAAVAAVSLGSARGGDKDIVTTAVEAGSFKTLAAALKAGDLVETLQGKGPFTVFAPTDEAFAALPAGTVESLLKPENKKQLVAVLTYHVVSGNVAAADVVKLKAAPTVNGQRVDIMVDNGTVRIDQAKVVSADLHCSNGTIHVVDHVLLPSSDRIPATAVKAGSFSTLLAAAKAAGLVDVLNSDGPLTVFAPTDAAFAKLPKGTVENLLKPENKAKLADILTYHVVPGRIYSDEVLSGKDLKTVQGEMLKPTVVKNVPMINNAKITATDIDTANGVIHVIDTVMLPPTAPMSGAQNVIRKPTYVSHVCPTTGRITYTVHYVK